MSGSWTSKRRALRFEWRKASSGRGKEKTGMTTDKITAKLEVWEVRLTLPFFSGGEFDVQA